MTGKKNPTKDAALLEALRSNLHLLGEIAIRYEVETQPECPTGDLPAINCPEDVRRLLGPEMAPLAQEQLRVLLLNTRNQVLGQRGHLPGQRQLLNDQARRGLPPGGHRGRPQHHHQPQPPQPGPDAQPGGRGHHQRHRRGWEAAGHRAVGPHRHRRRAVRQPQGTGPHVLTAHAVRLLRRGIAPRASTTHTEGDIPCSQPTR